MKILIGIPTIKSFSYIFVSLERIRKEIKLCPKQWDVVLVICLNGVDYGHKTENEIKRFFKYYNDINHYILVENQFGKNNAINQIIKFAKKLKDVDIIHFFDDDVYLQSGSLMTNIEALIENEKKNHKPVLVGSAFIVINHSLSFFLSRYSFFEAIKKWIFYIIIIQPYLLNSERPRFCEGPSLGSYLKNIPILPDDSTGITDDSFFSNYFAIKGKNDYEKLGIFPTIKPSNSIAFVEVSSNFKEWEKQQIRIHAGIERAFAYFEKERCFLEKYYSWSYAFNKESQTSPKGISLKKKILYYAYMYLHKKNRKKAQEFIKMNKVPKWTTAYTTKKLFFE